MSLTLSLSLMLYSSETRYHSRQLVGCLVLLTINLTLQVTASPDDNHEVDRFVDRTLGDAEQITSFVGIVSAGSLSNVVGDADSSAPKLFAKRELISLWQAIRNLKQGIDVLDSFVLSVQTLELEPHACLLRFLCLYLCVAWICWQTELISSTGA